MPYRITTIFQMTTIPTNKEDAQPRTSGWSESVWSTVQMPAAKWTDFAWKRAGLLNSEASIMGYRQQLYTISGNRLMPGGSSNFKQLIPGNAAMQCDAPQLALEIVFQGAGVPNTCRLAYRGLPDNSVSGGEYQPTAGYRGKVAAFIEYVTTAGNQLGFVGKDLVTAPVKVASVAAGVVQVQAPLVGVVAGQTFLKFKNCIADDGSPVKGSYLVTNVGVGGYTLQGMTKVVSKANGLVAVDSIGFIAFAAGKPSGLVVRKVGRPSRSYRGRASKRS